MYWTTKFCSKWLSSQVSDSTKYYARPHSAYVFASNKKSEREMARNWMQGFYIYHWWLDFGFYNEPFGEQFISTWNFDLPCDICFSWRTQLTFSVEMEIIQLWPTQRALMSSTTSLWHDKFNTRPHKEPNYLIVRCSQICHSNFKVISGEETEAPSIDQCEEDLYIRCNKCTSAKMDSVEY